ncbi:MAG: phosphoribosylformylglycinamidine synthase [Selenomonadaceae bacterium]|nr:phosphoribosylformylglycinamidine synthase [Selenomonadaceae bacterium]
MVRRIYVEKRTGFDVPAKNLLEDFKETLDVKNLSAVRLLVRYDIEDLSDEDFLKVRDIVFREPNVDNFYFELPADIDAEKTFAVEFLPGQFDQRADSAAQCVQLVTGKDLPTIHSAQVISLIGNISADDVAKIKNYSINAIESREASFDLPATLKVSAEIPADVEILNDFNDFDDAALKNFLSERGLAMNLDDLKFCQKYFRDDERRPPTITEIKVIDTYWSDHCRHTTFTTAIDSVEIESEVIRRAFDEYLSVHKPEKDISLMDLGTIGAKIVRPKNLDVSEEINACSIKITAKIDGRDEDWLVMFKNETHNHPTEIEPFGGAATCLGGAIRDPLSGRSYVYQAMRVTGAADPRKKFSETLKGKLPQKKIVRGAAQGYSSYGNQIGLATGQVAEIYHEGYLAKRMEIGAVIAAAPCENVVRERPKAGDKVILLGGRTGRDGIGGATGSSKVHTIKSLTTAGAEVQKGNPPTERKIQRLFRNPDAAKLIKRCNDFGAGGVAVAVGELSAGLKINLDAVRKKYDGLDGTELAISESQERMAVVLDAGDVEKFISLADAENLEAYEVAEVTDGGRMIMNWRGVEIVNISRKFFDTNGVKRHVTAKIQTPAKQLQTPNSSLQTNLRGLNVCLQKGLVERFDSTIGASTILMPFGGKNQLTPAEGMVAKIPCEGETSTATAMTFGFDAEISEQSPFHGAIDAVTSSLAKLTALGADFSQAYLTFQEYFEKLGDSPEKWGKPLAALLGAFTAQKNFGVAAIGGKDSMSGSFENLHVPPTLVSFAVAAVDAAKVISPEFKSAGHKIYLVSCPRDKDGVPIFDELKKNFSRVHELICAGKIISAASVQNGGIAAAISKMAIGNDIGFKFAATENIFAKNYGSLIVEAIDELDFELLGETVTEPSIFVGDEEISLDDVKNALSEPLEKIFPTKIKSFKLEALSFKPKSFPLKATSLKLKAKPKIFIPVFPGTNCEYDSAKVWRNAGGIPDVFVVKNLTPAAVEESISVMAKKIRDAQIIMLPGGFSGGDEPDGSGKFIAATFRNPRIAEEVMKLLRERDGLILGICNGFQALIKLGLLPYGEIRELEEDSPTLTHNSLGRHVSQYVRTRIASNLSPWLAKNSVGDVHAIPVSHGEGRFVASDAWLKKFSDAGQIATQYVDFDDNPTNELPFNPNGSAWAIEGITDASGKIFGKMGHSERIGVNVAKNIHGNKNQQLFEAGIEYFS